MSFTFQTDGEGFNVQIFLKTTLLKEPLAKSAEAMAGHAMFSMFEYV